MLFQLFSIYIKSSLLLKYKARGLCHHPLAIFMRLRFFTIYISIRFGK